MVKYVDPQEAYIFYSQVSGPICISASILLGIS